MFISPQGIPFENTLGRDARLCVRCHSHPSHKPTHTRTQSTKIFFLKHTLLLSCPFHISQVPRKKPPSPYAGLDLPLKYLPHGLPSNHPCCPATMLVPSGPAAWATFTPCPLPLGVLTLKVRPQSSGPLDPCQEPVSAMKRADLSVSAVSAAQGLSKANGWFRLLWCHFVPQGAYHGAKINVTFTTAIHPPSPPQVGFKDPPKINEWAVVPHSPTEVPVTPVRTSRPPQERGRILHV